MQCERYAEMTWTDTTPDEFALRHPTYAYEIQDTIRNIGDWSRSRAVDVKQFGAVGDGVTDDSGAIQAALAAVAIDGGCVVIPPGNYLISTTMIIADSVALVGTSREACRIFGDRMGVALIQGVFTAFSVADRNFGARIAHLTIENTSRNEAGGVALDLRQWSRVVVDNCRIRLVETGVRFEGIAFYNELRNTIITNVIFGVTVKDGSNSNSVYGGQISSCSTAGIDIESGPNNAISDFACFGTVFESNGSAVRLNGSALLPINSVWLYGPRIENNTNVLNFLNDAVDNLAVRGVGIYNAHAPSGEVMTTNDRGLRADWDKAGASTSKQALRDGLLATTFYRETSGAVTRTPTILASTPATFGAIVEVWVVGIEVGVPANMYERRHRAYAHGVGPVIDAPSEETFPVLDADARIGAIGAADSVLAVGGGDLRCEVTGVAGKDIRWWIQARWLGADEA